MTKWGEPRQFFELIKLYTGNDCIFWPYGKCGNGYACLEDELATRLMCEWLYGPPKHPSLIAAHSCGNGHLGCITPRHLRWATYKENGQDTSKHGRLKGQRRNYCGEAHHFTKLTEQDVLGILELKGICGPTEVSKIYSVKTNHGAFHLEWPSLEASAKFFFQIKEIDSV